MEKVKWPYKPILENGKYKALYTEPHNPHITLRRIGETIPENDNWECPDCGIKGAYETINDIPCTRIPSPCGGCGLMPICAGDCPGIASILSDPSVYIAGCHGIEHKDGN